MTTAVWNGAVLAESERCIVVEDNYYFPPENVQWEFFEKSQTHTDCPWKGRASYYDIVVNGQRNPDAAWYYPDPKPAAREIADYVAFWRGVEVHP